MEHRRISSSLTFLFKVLLPLARVGGFSSVTVLLFLQRNSLAWGYLLATVFGAIFLLQLFFRLKFVDVDDRVVYVTNFRRRITVPLSDIESVQQNKLTNIRLAFIVFREETAFGKSVMFMPQRSWQWRWLRDDAVVVELRRRAGFEGEWRPRS